MFGLSLKSKTKKVLYNYFNMDVKPQFRGVFNQMVDVGRAQNQNEFSIGFMYVLTMMNMLVAPYEDPLSRKTVDPKSTMPTDKLERMKRYIEKNSKTILHNMHLANSPESDIKELVQQVIANSLTEDDGDGKDNNNKSSETQSAKSQPPLSGREKMKEEYLRGLPEGLRVYSEKIDGIVLAYSVMRRLSNHIFNKSSLDRKEKKIFEINYLLGVFDAYAQILESNINTTLDQDKIIELLGLSLIELGVIRGEDGSLVHDAVYMHSHKDAMRAIQKVGGDALFAFLNGETGSLNCKYFNDELLVSNFQRAL